MLEIDSEMVDAKEGIKETKKEIKQFEKKQEYIKNVILYDFSARYYDTFLDKRVPGVEFKLKNKGNRTLNEVEVTVYFKDSSGTIIHEIDYHPVLVGSFSSSSDKPLKPNYVWQIGKDEFYKAVSVPDEWKEGSVSAKITNIEFADVQTEAKSEDIGSTLIETKEDFDSKRANESFNDDSKSLKETDLDFRNIKWGMSREEVKELQKTVPILEIDDGFIYRGKQSGFNVKIYYSFVSDKLVRAAYLIEENHTNKIDYISDYNTLKKLLIKKYGLPLDDNIHWKDDYYKENPQDWGLAISKGELVYWVIWENERTRITMSLRGDNYEIIHGVEYKSLTFEDLSEKERQKKELDGL